MPDSPDMSAFGIQNTIRQRDEGAEELPTLDEVVEENLAAEEGEPAPVQETEEPEDTNLGTFIEPPAAAPDEPDTDEGEEDPYAAMVERARQNAAGLEEPVVEETDDTTDAINYARRLGAIEADATAKIDAANARLQAYEEAKAAPAEPEVAPEDQALDLSDPRMVKAFQEAAGDPEAMAKLVGAVVSHEAKRLTKAEVAPLQTQVDNITATAEVNQGRADLGATVSAGLQAAYSMGGIEAALVKEYADNQDDSMIVAYLRSNPDTPQTQQGILSAVMTIARAVQRENDAAANSPAEDKPTPKLVAGTRVTSASQRGSQTLKKQRSKSSDGDAEVRDNIRGAKPQSKRLKFMNN